MIMSGKMVETLRDLAQQFTEHFLNENYFNDPLSFLTLSNLGEETF